MTKMSAKPDCWNFAIWTEDFISESRKIRVLGPIEKNPLTRTPLRYDRDDCSKFAAFLKSSLFGYDSMTAS